MFKQLREDFSCFEDNKHSRTLIEDENVPDMVSKKAVVSKQIAHKETKQTVVPQEPPEEKAFEQPKTFLQRLKYVLFGKF